MRLLSLLLVAAALPAQVPYERILKARAEPHNWLTYSGGYDSLRHTTLDQIRPENVAELELDWVYQAQALDKFEATPLVVDGVMYLTEPPNDVVALDAKTGRIFWEYQHEVPPNITPCCGRVNRGVALLDELVYVGTLDCHLIALDARTGRKQWDVEVCNYPIGYALALAPLVVKDKVIIGTAGGELGIRGFLAAYDAKTGEQAWKFFTVPGPGEAGHESWENDAWKTGGASIWVTGSYDPELNLTYWGVGNPGPDWNPDVRPGDNLYSSSVVALDADTGKLAWHFQFTPHDKWDWDSVQVPVLVDMEWDGKPRKLMLWGNRNGFFYVLDRATGEFLLGKPFIHQDWAEGLDAQGRPILVEGKGPSEKGSLTFPGVQGGTNWYSPTYSPVTGLFYLTAWEGYSSVYFKWDEQYEPGRWYAGGSPKSKVSGARRSEPDLLDVDSGFGAIRALDPKTGERRWELRLDGMSESGILSTATNVLFAGDRAGYFLALDARDGKLLWRKYLGGQVISGPMSFAVDGKQRIAVAAGHSLYCFRLRD
ncbi:MAG: PQQ-dependent dehydrogenase, methanol/ethanol family [Acidobacteria bacterium]|nr:PQQ-dependent dehydrogenase, methanol/ethanol family [Acidobacteriota bacterium]